MHGIRVFKHYRRAAVVAVAIAYSGLGALIPAANAHDVVMKANPADKSTVAEFPREIKLEFSGIPKDSFNTIALSNQDTGEVLFTESPKLDQQWVTVQVPDSVQPGPGKYKVGFQITSSDGHATRGMTTFEVAGNGSRSSEAAANDEFVASSSESPVSPNTYLFIGIGIAVAAIAAVAGSIFMLSKKRK